MNEIAIEKIKLGENIRKDYGDLSDLAASIKKNGILNPVVLDKQKRLRDGYRRIKAAEKVGIGAVPFIIREGKLDRIVDQLIAGIYPKNLTPFEEGRAFKEYMDATKCSAKTIAQQIGKTEQFVERRIKLNNAIKEVVDAWKKRQIETGHAALLGQLGEKQQKEALKIILQYEYSVSDFAEQLRWNEKIDFENATEEELPFKIPKKEKQKTLRAAGEELEGGSAFAQRPQFRKELQQYIKGERQKLQAKGIKVYDSEERLKKDYPKAKKVEPYGWDDEWEKAAVQLPGSKTYAVVVDWDQYRMKKDIYRIKEKKQKKAETTEETKEEVEKNLNMSRQEKLERRMSEFKREFLIEKSQKNMKAATHETRSILAHHVNYGIESVKDFYNKKPKEIDEHFLEVARNHVGSLSEDDLKQAAKMVEVDISKEFQMTEEFLNLYTKDKLIELAKELKIDVPDVPSNMHKRSELKDAIMDGWKNGQVPKLFKRL